MIFDGTLRKRPEAWVDFMMRFELGLEKPDPEQALLNALTIAAGVARPLSRSHIKKIRNINILLRRP